MNQADADRPAERHYLIAKGDLTAVQTLLQQGVIPDALARILMEKVKVEDQDIRLYRGQFRILD